MIQNEPPSEDAPGTRDRRTEDPSNFKRMPSEDDLGESPDEVSGGRSNALVTGAIIASIVVVIVLALVLL